MKILGLFTVQLSTAANFNFYRAFFKGRHFRLTGGTRVFSLAKGRQSGTRQNCGNNDFLDKKILDRSGGECFPKYLSEALYSSRIENENFCHLLYSSENVSPFGK